MDKIIFTLKSGKSTVISIIDPTTIDYIFNTFMNKKDSFIVIDKDTEKTVILVSEIASITREKR